MNSIDIRQNRDNDTLSQEIKNYLFGRKNKKELNCYTVLGFKDKDNFIKKNDPDHISKNPFLSVRRKRSEQIIKKKLKRINSQYPSNDNYTNEGIKEEGLSFIIDLKNGAQSYLASLQKEEAFKKNNDINKITEDKGSNLYRFKCALDYIEKIEERLGFSLEQTLEKTIDKFILVRDTDKFEKKFEKKIKKINKEHPFNLEFIDDNIQKNGLAFITELKQRAIFNIKKQDKSALLCQHYYIFNYIESMEKFLGFSVDSFSLLSQIRKDSIKILMNSNLHLAYDEGVAKKELSPLASYEECIKYQQRVNERDSSVEKSKAVVENDQQQIKETLQSDGKALVIKHMDISYSPSTGVKIPRFKNMIQKQKRLSFSNIMTLLLSIYGGPIRGIFEMRNFQTSVVTRVNWPDLSISMGVKNIKALEGSQKKLTSTETLQNTQQDNNKGESSNSFLKVGNGIFNSVKNWCYYNIVEPVVSFTGIALRNNTLNSNLNIDCKSEIEHGTSGQYTKISSDTINNASIDNKQTVNSQLYDVTTRELSDVMKYVCTFK